ncbi:MAG: bifunctional glutamate N-acetyltransferase/amino-acid acetyltransferase ArgJ [Desulfobacteraceae bacterium]|jgi:glutamate N-acetyltransferase/amino-acid N-acetyltransferase|nr:bifunctional glutamate N-acetyltransferase/amino-acid acetyltransferase ArgJ [Desulfobacteraceae bacterium]
MCQGFKAAGIYAGIKKNNIKDLGLIISDVPAAVAGVFTKNQIKAAPVLLDIERIRSGKCCAVIANSGNANCCTGEQGMKDAVRVTKAVAEKLGVAEEMVLVSSTGVIGKSLPVEKIETHIPQLFDALSSDGFTRFAESIMTTDTIPKKLSRMVEVAGKSFSLTGVAKGAGMIRPDMATMLSYVCTDVEADSSTLKTLLTDAVNLSFNRITIDGDTSTNDMVLIMANGMSGVSLNDELVKASFKNALEEMLVELAKMVVKDGEGVTKLVEIKIIGAASDVDAEKMADTVAHSPLVKTAFFGEDANWGRIIAALGRSGVSLNPDAIDISFNDIMLVKNGLWCGPDAEIEATKVMKLAEFEVAIDVHLGVGQSSCWTCDFSIDYVKINADYRS